MLNNENRSGILVGVDGSTRSDAAVRWAAIDAANHNEDLTLMTVLQRDDLTVRNEHYVPRLRRLRRLHATAMLTRAHEIAEAAVGTQRRMPTIRTEFVVGSPVPALVAESKNARMVVVGCRGTGILDRLILGSVSTGLIHHAHCPVAVVHDEGPTTCPACPCPARHRRLTGLRTGHRHRLRRSLAPASTPDRRACLGRRHRDRAPELDDRRGPGPRSAQRTPRRLARALPRRGGHAEADRSRCRPVAGQSLRPRTARRRRQPRPRRIRRHAPRISE